MPLERVDEDELKNIANETVTLSDENQQYFHENIDSIRDEYGGCTVAIINQEVVAAVEGRESHVVTSLINRLRHKYSKKDVAEAYITYISDEDDVMIL